MKFPKGIRRAEQPKRTTHRGAAWDCWDVILPDGKVVNGWLDTSWGTRFYFELDGVWRRGVIDHFKAEKPAPHFDLRDPRKLARAEAKIAEYRRAMSEIGADIRALAELGQEVELLAEDAGYNDHRRLHALHTQAEALGA